MADALDELIGKQWKEVHTQVRIKELLGDSPYRVWYPNSIGTMDYQPHRLNFRVNHDGVIVRIYYG